MWVRPVRIRTRDARIGTEAAAALSMRTAKVAAYGVGSLLTGSVLLYGVALTPASLLGAWTGKTIVGRISDTTFTTLVEAGLLAAGSLFLAGIA